MTDFFIKKQKKYWCEICRIFIEYNRITIEHHKNTSMHLDNMKRGTKYQKMKREYNNYVKDLREKQHYTNANNQFMGKKRYEAEAEKHNNTQLFNQIKVEMIKKELKIQQNGGNQWKVFYDKKYKNVFYFNFATGESQWDKPDDCEITEEEIQEVIEESKKKIAKEKEKHKEGNAGEWVKIDRKTANQIFGKRQDDYYEKLEKMTKKINDK